jgi:eukaryotic-like serine/threonine-protein kinase
VAVKVLKLGMDTGDVIARFDAERQVLAMMDHPNIAKVYDAGATSTGHPFFAMEVVRGTKITDFCDTNNLPTTARLQLFAQVCRAIQHAHLKGIIHRDIKPSNVLVSFHDGVAVPKVIDFGVAKATTGRPTDHTHHTATEQMIGTPLYMSPEQIEPGGRDVDTRSDVYSLGVLLYELMAGRPPFDSNTLAKSGFEAIRRAIRETDPPKPSTRLSMLGRADRAVIAQQRRTKPRRLVRQLRGDLDGIVMRCLEKTPARRYETASELARDVENHLNNRPVLARPPNALHWIVKLAVRHKVATASLATALGVLLLVAAAAAVTAVRAHRAELAEAQQSSRTDVTLGSRMIADGNVLEGLAFLVRAAQSDPDNPAIAPRLLSVLSYRSFPQPVGRPLTFVGIARDHAYSSDGRRVAVLTTQSAWLWNLADGSAREVPHANIFSQQTAFFGNVSSDLRRVATGGRSGHVSVRDAESGEAVIPPLPHAGSLSNALFSPDDRWLASAATDGSVKLWNPATGELTAAFQLELSPGESIRPEGIVFSPDSTRLLVTTLGTQWGIWRVPEGEAAIPVQRSSSARFSGEGEFSPDGSRVVIADSGGVQLHDAATGEPVGPHLDHGDPSPGVVFSRDGTRLATFSTNQEARVWRLSAPTKPQYVLRHDGGVQTAFFTTGDRHLVTLANDNVVRVWNLTSGELTAETDHHARVSRMLPARDGSEYLIFNAAGGSAQRWRVPAGTLAPLRLPRDASRREVRLANGGHLAYVRHADRFQRLAVPSLAPDGPARPFPAGVVPVWSDISLTGLDAVAVLGSGRDCELWDLRGTEIVRRLFLPFFPDDRPTLLWWSPDTRRLATHRGDPRAGTFDLDIWDVGSARRAGPTIRLPGPVADFKTLAISPDGRLVAVGISAYGVRLWETATGKETGEAFIVPIPVRVACFSPDGRWLATSGGDWAVQLWEANSHEAVGVPIRLPELIRGLEFSTDSRRLMTFTRSEVRMWEVPSGAAVVAPMRPMLAPLDDIVAAVLRQNDRLVAAVTSKGQVQLFDGTTGQSLLEPIQASRPGVFGLEVTDRYVAIASGPDLAVWPLPPLDLRVPVPGWLQRLAAATAGGTLDRFAAFRHQPVDEDTFKTIRAELEALPVNAPFSDWGRWILADPARRPAAPVIR